MAGFVADVGADDVESVFLMAAVEELGVGWVGVSEVVWRCVRGWLLMIWSFR